MKRKLTSFVLLSVLILTSLIGIFAVEGFGAGVDFNYNFINDNFFNSTTPISEDYNVKNKTEYTGHYNATYSFENEIDGTENAAIGFVDSVSHSGILEIQNNKSGHDKLIYFNPALDFQYFFNHWESDVVDGIVEFWVYKAENLTKSRVLLYAENTACMELIFEADNDISYYNVVAGGSVIGTWTENVWGHYKIDFRSIDELIDIYQNSVLIGDDLDFRDENEVYTHCDRIKFSAHNDNDDGEMEIYLDAVGYSWDGYYSEENINDTTEQFGTVFGDIANSNLDDTNHFNITSEDSGGTQTTSVYFNFTSLPTENVFLSYHLESNISIAFKDDDVNFDTGLILNDDLVSLGSVNSLRIEATSIFFAFNISVFYLKLNIFIPYYEVGDNIVPYQIVYDSYEVDKWDFHYEGIGDAFEVGDDNPNGWTDIEDGGGDEVNMVAGLYYEIESSGDESGTMKDDFGIDELHFLNFTITFNVAEISQVLNNYVYFRIYTNDSTEIARIFFDEEGSFGYYNGSSRVNLTTGLSEDVWYDFNFYIDYEIDLCVLRLNSSSSFIGVYYFPLFVLDKIGLSKIAITCPTDTGTTKLLIDDIGVYLEGESITSEFGFVGAGIGNYEGGEDYYENWYFEEHNLLSLDLIGDDVSVYMYLMEQSVIAPIWDPEVIVSSQDWYGEETFNMYDFTYDVHRARNYVFGGLLQFYIYSGTNLTLNEISMDGVRLNGTDGMFSLEYASAGVDELRNYFYVENNRLYYELITDDDDVEYMEATFDIVNHIAENRSISFKSDINGGSTGYFRVSYTDDTSTFIEIPTHATETSYILSQERDIDKFVIIISDYDKLNSGTTAGYVYEVKLVYYPNISAVITTFDLIAMIIPLMILLIPTFAVYQKFGEVALIPMFMLMSVICFIANLIPAWLFFVLLLGSGALLFGKKRITESF